MYECCDDNGIFLFIMNEWMIGIYEKNKWVILIMIMLIDWWMGGVYLLNII